MLCKYSVTIMRMSGGIKNSISTVSHIHSLAADFLTGKLSKQGLENFASSHGNILYQLSLTDKMRLHELSEKINRDKSTTTVLVRKLEQQGLVQTQSEPDDKRVKLISLTQKGRDYNDLTARISVELADTFFEGFTEDEKNTLAALLSRVEKNFMEVDRINE